MSQEQKSTRFIGLDIFKLIVAVILIIILILLLLRGCGAAGGVAGQPATTLPPTPEKTEAAATPEAATPEATVGVEAVQPPVLISPEDGASLAPGDVTFSGTGMPGSEVEITVDGQSAATTPVGDDGAWSAVAAVEGPGEHQVVAATVNPSGDNAAAPPITITITEPSGEVVPVITAPTDGAEVPAGALTIEGTGAPGTELEIVQDGAVVGTTTVGADGRWSASVTPEPGEHVYTARPSGNEALTSAPVRVTVKAETAGCDYHTLGSGYMPDQHHYVVGPCDTLSGIAAWLGVTVEALLAANPQITDPNLIYPGMVINVP